MINTIRTYFLNRVQEVDANLIDYRTDVFANNAPEGYETRKYFNLSIGNCVPRRIDNTYVDSFNVTLDVFTSQARDIYGEFEALYCKALKIKDVSLNPVLINNEADISDIVCELIEPLEDDTNDNSFKIRLNFIVTRNYSY